ncbi:glycosyltransferase family 2 protein [Pseudoruegeria sp. HB172150]|uniref:glycosyltransferase family 2 protein n=1 Tax=Pseudoruegeria sp. HB172150 TaxID=2721164 RepID=UPI0015534E1B|nr:glycosyltransferase family 2 protein [Pseudoruegeria sp. HB172150]
MSERVFLRRALNTSWPGGLLLLDALRLGPDSNELRLWFGQGTESLPAITGDLRIVGTQRVGENLIARGEAAALNGPVNAEIGGRHEILSPSLPETDLFDGLNTLCAQCYAELPEVIADWLQYHIEQHGAEAALIVDRSAPGPEQEAFAAALSGMRIEGLQKVMLVTAPVPLGQSDQPAFGDPLTAPRLKARPVPDPWRAPLGEAVLYDILKWRFLGQAGAVVALDVCELLTEAEDDFGVFDAVRRSPGGALPLKGEAIYPWRVKKAKPPGFGDHICHADPPVPAPRRWAVAPRRSGPGNLWLPGMLLGHAVPKDEYGSYHRCMSVVQPQNQVQDLIDKALLVEDASLLERAYDVFGAKPVRPPAAPKPVLPSGAGTTDRTVVVTCMKNEGPFILEWLAYHRMIGVSDFLIYTNDCTDGTDTMLDMLQAKGLVQRRDNPFREMDLRPQHAALDVARGEEVLKSAGWILPIDVDEFVNIHVGAGHLNDLYTAIAPANLISLTWRLFGNSDRDTYEDRPVTEQFTRCAPELIRRPHQAWGFKTLYRNLGLFADMGVHRPKGLTQGAADKVHWVNGSGQPMPRKILRTGWRSSLDSYGYDLVTLNHYAVRNAESFLVKRDRGRVNHVDRDQGEAYWFRMNNNAEQDHSIQRHLPALRQEIDRLLQDPEIAAAHAACVEAHQARIAELSQREDYAALYTSLTSTRMKRLSTRHAHFGANVFLTGPSCLPREAHAADLAPDYFFNAPRPKTEAEG